MKRILSQEDEEHKVDETLNNSKLYSACRKFFPSLSKSQLRDALKEGAVSLNGDVMEIKDDTRRVKVGDLIHIDTIKQTMAMEKKLLHGHGSDLRIHYTSNHFAIVEKFAGEGCHPTSEFHLRLKYLLWEGEMVRLEKQKALKNEKMGTFEGLQLLYNPGKAASGLLVVVRNSASMIYVRSLLETKKMKKMSNNRKRRKI